MRIAAVVVDGSGDRPERGRVLNPEVAGSPVPHWDWGVPDRDRVEGVVFEGGWERRQPCLSAGGGHRVVSDAQLAQVVAQLLVADDDDKLRLRAGGVDVVGERGQQ